MLLLPNIRTEEDYRLIYRDADVWLPAMRVICQRHGLDATQLEFAPPGTHVVFQVRPDRYVKLFAPPWRKDFVPEWLVLRRLSEQLDLPVPRLVAEGTVEDWPYVIVTAVEGVPLCEVWHSMDLSDREHIAASCGGLMAALHALTYKPAGGTTGIASCGGLMAALHAVPTKGLEAIAVDWPTFVESQIQGCTEHLIRSGLDEGWMRAVLEFLDNLPPLFEPGFRPVLLSADVTDEHILVSQRGGRWELAGFLDFGDAMLGHPHYEFVAPGCCITRGSPRLQRVMLLAYGYSGHQLDGTLARQLMAYTLLHRFVNVPDLLALFGSQRPASFEELGEALWSFSTNM